MAFAGVSTSQFKLLFRAAEPLICEGCSQQSRGNQVRWGGKRLDDSSGLLRRERSERRLVRTSVQAYENGGLVSSSNGAAKSLEEQPTRAVSSTIKGDFFSCDTEGDPDHPSEGFASITEAIEAIRNGELVVVVDHYDRENEGDLIMAGALVTPEKMAFIVNNCSGLVCVGVEGAILDRLQIPLMVPVQENGDQFRTAFTVSVDLKEGTSTGISASDRAKTIRALANGESRADEFRRPGHIFPLRYREGGVLGRAGHTEAAVDLAKLAGLPGVGVLCEVVNPDGTMSRLPQLRELAEKHGMKLISIEDLIRYRQKRERLVERTAVARLPTKWGVFQIYSYLSKVDNIEHTALVKGDIGDGTGMLVRIHSECLTGDIFQSQRCDCGPQLALAMKKINEEGRGVCVYLRGHEGRGIGLGHKLQAYNLQDMGRDTVEANVDLGFPEDAREYGVAAQILRDVGVKTMRLMTNNPAKYLAMKGLGLAVTERVPVLCPVTLENRKYLETKRSKMGHIYESDQPGTIAGVSLQQDVKEA